MSSIHLRVCRPEGNPAQISAEISCYRAKVSNYLSRERGYYCCASRNGCSYGRIIETGKTFVWSRGPFRTSGQGATARLYIGRPTRRGGHPRLEQIKPGARHCRLRAGRRPGGGGGGGEGIALDQGLSRGCRSYPAGNGGPVYPAFGFLYDRCGGLDWQTGRRQGSEGFH